MPTPTQFIPRDEKAFSNSYNQQGEKEIMHSTLRMRIGRALALLTIPVEVAREDQWMNYPEGAKMPWPPYYDLILAKAFAPFARQPGSPR